MFDFEDDDQGSVSGMTLSTCENGFHETIPHHRVREAASYDNDALAKFSGTYISPELGAIYRVRLEENRLELRVGSRRWEPMVPLKQDEFSPVVNDPHNTRFLRFTRDDTGSVTGFSIGFWRIHGVRFERVNTESQPGTF